MHPRLRKQALLFVGGIILLAGGIVAAAVLTQTKPKREPIEGTRTTKLYQRRGKVVDIPAEPEAPRIPTVSTTPVATATPSTITAIDRREVEPIRPTTLPLSKPASIQTEQARPRAYYPPVTATPFYVRQTPVSYPVSTSSSGKVWVKGYTRKDGTVVRGHYRSR